MHKDEENSFEGYTCLLIKMQLAGFSSKGSRRTVNTELDIPGQVIYEGCLKFSSTQDVIEWPLKLYFDDSVCIAEGKIAIKVHSFRTSSSNIQIKV